MPHGQRVAQPLLVRRRVMGPDAGAGAGAGSVSSVGLARPGKRRALLLRRRPASVGGDGGRVMIRGREQRRRALNTERFLDRGWRLRWLGRGYVTLRSVVKVMEVEERRNEQGRILQQCLRHISERALEKVNAPLCPEDNLLWKE